MPDERSWIRPIAAEVRVVVRTRGRPVSRYAVTLEVLRTGQWQTVQLLDNAHGQHDIHRYTGGAKQPAERFMEGALNDVLPEAIRYLVNHWEAIVRAWST